MYFIVVKWSMIGLRMNNGALMQAARQALDRPGMPMGIIIDWSQLGWRAQRRVKRLAPAPLCGGR